MAVSHLYFNETTAHGRQFRAHLIQTEQGYEGLNDDLAVMARMIDGDGSSADHFTYMTAKYGFPDNATAKAAWDELNSLMGKLNTDGSVTFVNAALLQVFSKFR